MSLALEALIERTYAVLASGEGKRCRPDCTGCAAVHALRCIAAETNGEAANWDPVETAITLYTTVLQVDRELSRSC